MMKQRDGGAKNVDGAQQPTAVTTPATSTEAGVESSTPALPEIPDAAVAVQVEAGADATAATEAPVVANRPARRDPEPPPRETRKPRTDDGEWVKPSWAQPDPEPEPEPPPPPPRRDPGSDNPYADDNPY